MGLFDWFRRPTPATAARVSPGTDPAGVPPEAPVTGTPSAHGLPAELSGTWTIDPSHTSVGFIARHAMVTNVRGTFDEIEGVGVLDTVNPAASTATVTMQAASINTNSEDRDVHLRSADFFDVETYPELRFVSTSIGPSGSMTLSVAGDLTVKDVTRRVTVDLTFTGVARDPSGSMRAGFEGETSVDRRDWGLVWNTALETGGVLVSDRIRLVFDVSAIREE